jgi:hypothetical protein
MITYCERGDEIEGVMALSKGVSNHVPVFSDY